MRFNITLTAIIEATSAADAAVQADRIKDLLGKPTVTLLLRGSGVRMVGGPSVGKPEEKK